MQSPRPRVRTLSRFVPMAVVCAAMAVVAGVGTVPAFAAAPRAHVHRSGAPEFAAPSGVALVGNDLFVANSAGNSVSELNQSTGALVATISATKFGFKRPTAIVAVGNDLFVANGAGNSVSELTASTRRHVRTVKGSRYGFNDPVALAASGADLFVLNHAGSLTEITTAKGALLGAASGPAFGFHAPTGLAVARGRVFVANSTANTVTVVNAATRAHVATLSGPTFAFDSPIGVAFDGADIWVTNQGDESVTELSASTLAALNVIVSGNLPMVGPIAFGDGYIFTLSPPGSSPMVTQIVPSPATVTWMMCNTNGPYLFNNPQALVVAGSHLWVVNEGGSSLTEMDADSGALIRTL